jgi:site-specific recombinase XerC
VRELSETNESTLRDWARKLHSEGRGRLIVDRHRFALLRLEDFAGGATLTELQEKQIREWVIGLKDVTKGTRKTYFSSARAFYNFAVFEGIIDVSPMARMKEPQDPKVPVPIPAKDDVRALIAVCEADKSIAGIRDAAMIRIMCDTGGPRAAEVAGMLIHNPPKARGVDLREDEITVCGKNDMTRTWPIANNTARAASKWLRARGKKTGADRQPYFFLSVRGAYRTTRECPAEMLIRRCAQAGVPHIHPHQLRHFAVDCFYAAGGREGDAKRLFGWTDDEMPRHYAEAHADKRAGTAGRMLAIGDQF